MRPSIHDGVVVSERRCVKQSKLALPRYAPVPEVPTPPKASVGMDAWKKPLRGWLVVWRGVGGELTR
jgi:hypothetical protein